MISDVEMYGEILKVVRRQVELGLCMKGFLHHLEMQEKQLRTLQGVVGSLQQDVATLEEKVSVMERMLNVEVCTDDVDDGEAERAEYERFMQEERAGLL